MPRSRQPRRSQGTSGCWQTRRIPQPGLTTFTPLPAPLARSLPVLALCTAQQRSQERGVAGGAPCGSACGSADRASNLAATSLQCCSASACEMGLPTGSRMDSEWDSSTTAFRSSSARETGEGEGGAPPAVPARQTVLYGSRDVRGQLPWHGSHGTSGAARHRSTMRGRRAPVIAQTPARGGRRAAAKAGISAPLAFPCTAALRVCCRCCRRCHWPPRPPVMGRPKWWA